MVDVKIGERGGSEDCRQDNPSLHVLPQVVNITRLSFTLVAYIPESCVVDVRIGERGGK